MSDRVTVRTLMNRLRTVIQASDMFRSRVWVEQDDKGNVRVVFAEGAMPSRYSDERDNKFASRLYDAISEAGYRMTDQGDGVVSCEPLGG